MDDLALSEAIAEDLQGRRTAVNPQSFIKVIKFTSKIQNMEKITLKYFTTTNKFISEL